MNPVRLHVKTNGRTRNPSFKAKVALATVCSDRTLAELAEVSRRRSVAGLSVAAERKEGMGTTYSENR